MTILTIKINKRTKAGKAFLAMSESFFKGVNGIEIIEQDSKKVKNELNSLYNPEFVAMVKKAHNSKIRTVIDPNDLWGSIGLK